MFGRFKKKPEPEEHKAAKVNEDPKASEETSKKAKKTRKSAKSKPATISEDTISKSPQISAPPKEAEIPFIGIKNYSSTIKIVENIDWEIAGAKRALGEYLRQLDDKRGVAEKTRRLHDVVAKMANKKETKKSSNQIEVNGLEIILDATALNELDAIESVVKSYQQRLTALQQAREALKTLDQVGDTEGIKYLALEREGIPEQILLKLS
jgi:hypothetical protein